MNDLKLLPQAERLLSGTISASMDETQTTVDVSNPPSATKLPSYWEIEPDSTQYKELVRITGVSSSTVTLERGLNNGGVGFPHSSLAPYKQKITSLHWDKVVQSLDSGYLTEDTAYTFTRVSTSSFKVTASGVDRTTQYFTGRVVRLNGSVVTTIVSSSYSNPDTTVVVEDTTVPTPITSIELAITTKGTNYVSERKATGAEINTGTEDAKIVTPKAIADSYLFNVYNSLYRQALINGNFDVWQRGTTVTNPTGAVYSITDRWQEVVAAFTTTMPSNIVHSRQALTPGDIPGSYYFYRVAPDGAGSNVHADLQYRLRQKIEHGTRLLCGLNKKVTLSFYARASVANKRLGIFFQQVYGTGGSPSSAETISGGTKTLTSSWTKYTVTVTTNTLVGKTFGTANDDSLSVVFSYAWGSSDGTSIGATGTELFGGSGTIDIAQVQLCAGDVALPFMPKSFEEELRACQRYCFVPESSNIESPIGFGTGVTTTRVDVFVPLPTTMRIVPILTATAGDWRVGDVANAPIDVTGISLVASNQSANRVRIQCDVSSGITQYRPYQLSADSTANRLLILSAEL